MTEFGSPVSVANFLQIYDQNWSICKKKYKLQYLNRTAKVLYFSQFSVAKIWHFSGYRIDKVDNTAITT